MKLLALSLIFLFSVPTIAKSTYHKTANGKYPHYYTEEPGDTPWDDKDQAAYDKAVDTALEDLCFKTAEVKKIQADIDEEKEVSKVSGYVDALAIHNYTMSLLRFKKEIEPTAKTIKDETGKDVSSYPCANSDE